MLKMLQKIKQSSQCFKKSSNHHNALKNQAIITMLSKIKKLSQCLKNQEIITMLKKSSNHHNA